MTKERLHKEKEEEMKHHPITKKEHALIKTLRKHEKKETRSEERKEPKAYQKLEKRLGVEMHKQKTKSHKAKY